MLTDTEEFLESPLGKAFTRLNEEGIRSHGECGRTQSEGAYLITADGYEGPWVFFTHQDHEMLLSDNGCFINCGIEPPPDDDAKYVELYKRVIKILEEEGITCKWDDDFNTRISIDVNYKHRAYMSFVQLFHAACFNDANLYMLTSIAYLVNEDTFDPDDEEDYIRTFNATFNSSKEELKEHGLYTFEANEDYDLSVPKGEYSSEEEFLEALDWDEIYESIHEYCDEETIRGKLAKCLEKNIQDIDFKKTVSINNDD